MKSRPAFARLFVAVVALVAAACSRRSTEPVAQMRQALTVAEVMGLEDPSGWSTTTAGATLTRSSVHSQGSFSLQLAPSSSNGFTPIVSVPLSKPPVIGPRMAFDIMLPTQQANPSWFGTVQIYVDCPSRNIFSAFLAQVELTGKPLGVFTTVDFPVANATIAPLLNPGYTDLRFTLVVNVQVPTTGVYRLDNLRFLPAPANGCGGRPNGTFCDDASACTTGESCQAGACTSGTTVTCTTDQCHTVGACVPATGCPAPVARPNGTSCNDGNACTSTDRCQAGTCTGGTAVTCTTDQCHTVGACVPATGCPTPVNRPNGTTCNDNSACTSADACQAGTCTGSAVTCTTDQCHTVGACVPATGCPAAVSKPNGTSCNDANACSTGEACQTGTCTGGSAVACTGADQCHTVGACVPASGCPAPVARTDGTACDDDDACTTSDHCTGGACDGEARTCEASDACHVPGACDPETGECSDPQRPTNGTTVSGFDYDGAGRQIRDGDADLAFDGYDQLRDLRPRTSGAPKFNDGKPVTAEHHSYCYDGERSSTTRSPGTPSAETEYWFSPDYVEREGRRDHYIRVGDRLVARISTVAPAQGATTVAPPAAKLDTLTGASADDQARGRYRWLLEAALLVALGGLFGRELVRRRRAPFRTLLRVAVVPLIGCLACESLRSGRDNEALAWDVVETLFFHQGIAAGPVLLTDSSGAVVEERRYEPFGQPIDARRGSGSPGDVDFAREAQNILNKQTDVSTGWSDHGARWMAPQSARWLSPDPALQGPKASTLTAPWGLNPYQYSAQAPSAFWDPNGQWGIPIFEPRVNVQFGQSLHADVVKVPQPNARNASQTDFYFRVVVDGAPKDLRWEQFVRGGWTVHWDGGKASVPVGDVLWKFDPRDGTGSRVFASPAGPDPSSPFSRDWYDDNGKLKPGPHEVGEAWRATNANGIYTFDDTPGEGYRFGYKGMCKHGGSDCNEREKRITGITFDLEFEQKLYGKDESDPFYIIRFKVEGTRTEKQDNVRITDITTRIPTE